MIAIENIITFDDLNNELAKYIQNQEMINKIFNCYKFAEEKHRGQKRKSGNDFIQHPLYTALYLAKWRLGTESICAALLHDILEDTPITFDELEAFCGTEIAKLVESITKVSFFAKENRNQIKSLYLRKLYISLAKDIRVIIIKIADRLHNMKTISFHNKQKQKEIASETLEIYSAISHRLGMKEVQSKLEDLSFKVLNKKEYKRIESLLWENKDKLEKVLANAKAEIKKEISIKLKRDFTIITRAKSIYSIYRKINILGKSFADIYDILALRIIVDSIDECYNVLGLIHQLFVPLPGKFKDYISVPKNNLYQSLHTTVTNSGHIFEVQIRTTEMDQIAKYGAAAHWRYKEGENYTLKQKQEDIENKLDIFSQILEFQNNESFDEKSINFENEIKQDIFSSLIYVLTPKGKVITLPFGSTTLDFAYKVHSEIGNSTIGAKINGVFSSMSATLNSGDLVEIITSKIQKPNYSWLEFVKTNSAKDKIKKYLKKTEINNNLNKKISNIKRIKIIKQKIKDLDNKQQQYLKKPKFLSYNWEINNRILQLGYENMDNFLLDVYDKTYSINEAYEILFVNKNSNDKEEKIIKDFEKRKSNKRSFINDLSIKGIDNINISLSKCCMPIPFEKIYGVISNKSKIIKVHLWCCKIIKAFNKNDLIDVRWNVDNVVNKTYPVRIMVISFDNAGIIMKISSLLNYYNSSIETMIVNKVNKKMLVIIKIVIKVNNKNTLKKIISSINKIQNVKEIKRLIH